MKTKWLILSVSVALVVTGAYYGVRTFRASRSATRAAAIAKYHCPMHPSFTSDKPGQCPICNMALVPDEPGNSAADASGLAKICLLHKCKMAHCVMELPVRPGEKITCPICGVAEAQVAEIPKGKPLYYRNPMHPEVTSPTPKKDEMGMDYVPVYSEELSTSDVPGQGSVVLSEERRQMIGMKSVSIQKRDLASVVRATGRVAYDPDLYHAISEYREAVKGREAVKESPYPDVHERSSALVTASELRLRQIGLSKSQIARIATSTEPPTNLLFSQAGGTVWVYAQIYEYEIALVKPGQKVELATLAYPGRKFHGTVKAVDPILSPETRSLKARIEVPNPDGLLKLEMYVDAMIRTELGRKLALPDDALVDTGERKLVFIDLGNGRIEPREVQVGRDAEGYYEVLSGLKEGEKVVTAANFLIDSESKLKGAIQKAGHEHQH